MDSKLCSASSNSLSGLYIQVPPPSHTHLIQYILLNPNTSLKHALLSQAFPDSPPSISIKVRLFFFSAEQRKSTAETGGYE